jgi:lipoate-protein ligase A
LGYFQEHAAFANTPGSHVIVRRSTGGGAIYHQEEITFSLSLDIQPNSPSIVDWYRGVHEAVRTGLSDLEIPVEFFDKPSSLGREEQRRSWCFSAPGPEDLVSRSGGKILGSAQRRISRPSPRLLHHASLIMRAPAASPGCGSVAEYGPPEEIGADLEAALIDRLSRFLGLEPSPEGPDEAEEQLARKLAEELHADSAHLLRR